MPHGITSTTTDGAPARPTAPLPPMPRNSPSPEQHQQQQQQWQRPSAVSAVAAPDPAPLREIRQRYEGYQLLKAQCTEAYLTRVERTVDGFLVGFYNTPSPGSLGAATAIGGGDVSNGGGGGGAFLPSSPTGGVGAIGGGGGGGAPALINKAGAKLTNWFRQAAANIKDAAQEHQQLVMQRHQQQQQQQPRLDSLPPPGGGGYSTPTPPPPPSAQANNSNSNTGSGRQSVSASLTPTPTPPPPPYPMHPLHYTANAVPEDYIDRRPSGHALRCIIENYPILMHTLKHLIPPTAQQEKLPPLPQQSTAAVLTGNALSQPLYGSVPHMANANTASTASALSPRDAGPIPEQQQQQQQLNSVALALTIIADPTAHLRYSARDQAAIGGRLLLPAIAAVWREYLQPLRDKLEETIALADRCVSLLLQYQQQQQQQLNSSSSPAVFAEQQRECERMHGSLDADLAYICTIRNMDTEFVGEYHRCRQAQQQQQEGSESSSTPTADVGVSNSTTTTTTTTTATAFASGLTGASAGQLSDHVPVYGLVMSRLHRLEMEHRTVLELWAAGSVKMVRG